MGQTKIIKILVKELSFKNIIESAYILKIITIFSSTEKNIKENNFLLCKNNRIIETRRMRTNMIKFIFISSIGLDEISIFFH